MANTQQHRVLSVSAVVIITAVLAALPLPLAAETPLDKDFRLLMELFPGRYDNNNQVMFAEEAGVPEDSRHERVHHLFLPIDLPAFGENVLFVQQYTDNDPDNVYRVRVYSFAADYDEGAVRLSIWRPGDERSIIDAYADPERLAALSPDQFVNVPGCDVFWIREADHFRGYMKPNACVIESRRDGRRIVIDDDLLLTREEIWISDRAEYEDGSYAFGNRAGIPHKNKRVRLFTCWVAVAREQGEGWYFVNGLELHDQGGVTRIVTDDPAPRMFYLRMARPVWPTGNNKPSTVVYLHGSLADGGMGESLGYGWGTYDAGRVGVNLKTPGLQASCSLLD